RRRILSSKDPSVVTVLLEDTAALLGLIAAFVGILLAQLTGDTRFDGLGSIVIGAVLTVVSVFLTYESRGLLVGQRADGHGIHLTRPREPCPAGGRAPRRSRDQPHPPRAIC